MSIRILTLATAAATTLEGSIVWRHVRLVRPWLSQLVFVL